MDIELTKPNNLLIKVQDNDGIISMHNQIKQQAFGQRDMRLLCLYRGRKLYDILADDHGLIVYNDNKLVLGTILTNDDTSLMRVMGKVAESIIARRCTESLALQKLWMFYGSGTLVRDETAKRYTAVGTGFKSTERNYPPAYNPQDKQRDIIWIETNGFHYPVRGSTSSGAKDAGLQVKISKGSMFYDLRKWLLEKTYEVPIVYFDLGKDYEEIFDSVMKNLVDETPDSLRERFISVREADEDAYYEAEYYTEMIQAVIDGRLSVDDLVKKAEDFPTFGSAVMATALQNVADTTLILPSNGQSPLLY